MAIEAMKGAGMSYAGSSSASDVKAESQAKVETASNAAASDDLMKKTIQIDTKETNKNGKDGNRDDSQAKQTISENSQIRKAVDEINKKAHNSAAAAVRSSGERVRRAGMCSIFPVFMRTAIRTP